MVKLLHGCDFRDRELSNTTPAIMGVSSFIDLYFLYFLFSIVYGCHIGDWCHQVNNANKFFMVCFQTDKIVSETLLNEVTVNT